MAPAPSALPPPADGVSVLTDTCPVRRPSYPPSMSRMIRSMNLQHHEHGWVAATQARRDCTTTVAPFCPRNVARSQLVGGSVCGCGSRRANANSDVSAITLPARSRTCVTRSGGRAEAIRNLGPPLPSSCPRHRRRAHPLPSARRRCHCRCR